MIVSPICEMLGIKYPIFQGGMAWIADGKLAAAVSNGGGLGIISAMNAGGDYLREQIRIARSLTDKPFGVNIMLMSPHVQEVAKIVAEEKVAVVTTGAGIPNQYVPMWKEAGIKVIPVAASVAAAKMMARAGADAVLAEECVVHQNYKDMVKKATDVSTTATGRRFGGSTCRVMKNQFARHFLQVEYAPETTAEMVDKLGVGALRKAAVEGDTKEGCFMAGQIAGMVKKEQPAAEIVREIAAEAEALLKGAAKWVK